MHNLKIIFRNLFKASFENAKNFKLVGYTSKIKQTNKQTKYYRDFCLNY